MNKIIRGVPWGTNRCRNSEAEIARDLSLPADTVDEIAMHDRIIELMGDPNATDTNLWFDFWENNLDVWADFATINTNRDARKLLEDWQFNFLSNSNCPDKCQAWSDLQKQPEFGKIFDIVHCAIELLNAIQAAAEEQAEREKCDDE